MEREKAQQDCLGWPVFRLVQEKQYDHTAGWGPITITPVFAHIRTPGWAKLMEGRSIGPLDAGGQSWGCSAVCTQHTGCLIALVARSCARTQTHVYTCTYYSPPEPVQDRIFQAHTSQTHQASLCCHTASLHPRRCLSYTPLWLGTPPS